MTQRSSAVKTKKTSAKRPVDRKAKRSAAPPVASKIANGKPARLVASPAKARPASAPSTPVVVKKPDAKPAKPVRTTTLSKSELNHFRDLLLQKRREILGDVGTMESEAFKLGSNLSNMPIHMADVGTDNFEQEFTLGLIESERKMLREIQGALGRIEDGSYGICQGTGKIIPKVRLEAVPWAKYSLEYAKALESGQIRHESSPGGDDDSSDDDED